MRRCERRECNGEALTAHFSGKPIGLWFDPMVKFAGKRVGGLRLCTPAAPPAARQQAAPAPEPPPAEEPPVPESDWAGTADPDEDIPF